MITGLGAILGSGWNQTAGEFRVPKSRYSRRDRGGDDDRS